jgi:hypothetical protein
LSKWNSFFERVLILWPDNFRYINTGVELGVPVIAIAKDNRHYWAILQSENGNLWWQSSPGLACENAALEQLAYDLRREALKTARSKGVTLKKP